MLPAEADPDSDWEILVLCDKSTFQAPQWPSGCVEARFCADPPDPPEGSSLQRLDNRFVTEICRLTLQVWDGSV